MQQFQGACGAAGVLQADQLQHVGWRQPAPPPLFAQCLDPFRVVQASVEALLHQGQVGIVQYCHA